MFHFDPLRVFLLKNGASAAIPNAEGRTVLDLIAEREGTAVGTVGTITSPGQEQQLAEQQQQQQQDEEEAHEEGGEEEEEEDDGGWAAYLEAQHEAGQEEQEEAHGFAEQEEEEQEAEVGM